MLGRNSRPIADWTRKDFMFDLNQLLVLSVTGIEGLRECKTQGHKSLLVLGTYAPY